MPPILMQIQKLNRMTKILVSLVVVFFIGGVISTVFAADNAVDRGTVEVKESINENAVTDVGSSPSC